MDNISQKFNNKQHKNELPLLIRNSYHKNHPFISINSDLNHSKYLKGIYLIKLFKNFFSKIS